MRAFAPPAAGVALTKKLAEVLGAEPGSTVALELLEGERRVVDVTVNALVDDMFGLFVHASPETVRRLANESGNVTSVLLVVDPGEDGRLMKGLARLPHVASITRRDDALARFRDQTEYMWVSAAILTLMGATIAFGVVYNQARIALSTRARDLASLRVLGFTRREISSILLGELALYVAVGVPAGWVLGHRIAVLISSTVDPESYRMPAFVSTSTYAFATLVTVLAAVVSALIVRRGLDRLDLVSVLKARE